MFAFARRIVATTGFLGVLLTSCGDSSETENGANGANAHICDLLTKMATAESRVDGDDLTSMRAQVPALAGLAAALAEGAPDAIRNEARVLRESMKLLQSEVEKPDLVLKENTLYLWTTDETKAAGETIRQWSLSNCDEPVDQEVLKPVTLMVCLRPGATSDDVQAVLARTSTPSKTRRGNELLEGITGVAARPRAVSVKLNPLITAERKAELLAILGASPVESVRPNTDTCD